MRRLNRTTAPQILRFYDVCFKQGVIDACEHGDDLGSKEFLERKTEDWTFGVLGKEEDMDWQAFRFVLYWWARKSHLGGFGDNYIFSLKTKAPTWCLIPYCMRFYLLGISEWLEYPNPVNLQVFKGQSKLHWSPSAGMSKFSKGDYFSYMHDFQHRHRQLSEELKQISDTMMEGFCASLYDLTSDFRRGEDEDI